MTEATLITTNSTLLRHAMKYLGISGTELAAMLTRMRDDGKKTTQSTVSRWMMGDHPVEPALIGWLTELVRKKLANSKRSFIQWPASRRITIAVTNVAGGVGSTTVSINLAAISSLEFGLRTRHVHLRGESSQPYPRELLTNIGIRSEDVPIAMASSIRADAFEVVVIDIARSVMSAAVTSNNGEIGAMLNSLELDAVLVPADFDSSLDAESTRELVHHPVVSAPMRLLHRPRGMSMKFASIAAQAGLDVSSQQFCPKFVPQSLLHPVHLPLSASSTWQDEEQRLHHFELFDYLVGLVGGRTRMPAELHQSIKTMTLSELLSLAD